MKTQRSPLSALGIPLCLLLGSLLLLACGRPAKIRFIDLPKNVVAVLGEAEAFETSAEADSSTETALDIGPILKRVKTVESIDLLAWDKGGVFTPVSVSKKESAYYAQLQPNMRYVVLGVVNQRARDTYGFMCHLFEFERASSFQRVPEICQRILCGSESVPVDELLGSHPELRRNVTISSMTGGIVGGFGATDCDACLNTSRPIAEPVITPGVACLPGPSNSFGAPFIFARKGANGSFQIFKSANGTESNLSNNSFSDEFPDVTSSGGKIAFTSTNRGTNLNGLHTMNPDGSLQTLVHASNEPLSRPRWAGERVIAFTQVSSNSSIFVLDIEGTLFQVKHVTFPGNRQNDNFGHDFLDSKHLVFSRSDLDENDFTLFDLEWNAASSSSPAVVRLTQTPDVSEEFPALSHDGTMLAFRELVFAVGETLNPTAERIKVISANTLDFGQPLFQVSLAAPAQFGITGLDFTADDKGLLVAVKTAGVQAADAKGLQEIFFIRLDGSGQQRLTNNNVADLDPRALP